VSRGLAGFVLFAAAAGVWLGLTLPAQRQRDLARAEYAHAREERERLRAQAVALERQGAAARTPQAGAAAARALRASLLAATRGLPVGAVQIAASAAQGRLAARGRLSAVGSIAAVVRLAERLAAMESGLQVDRIDLIGNSRAGDPGIRLDADVFLERAGP
jgi:hypothetical protein